MACLQMLKPAAGGVAALGAPLAPGGDAGGSGGASLATYAAQQPSLSLVKARFLPPA